MPPTLQHLYLLDVQSSSSMGTELSRYTPARFLVCAVSDGRTAFLGWAPPVPLRLLLFPASSAAGQVQRHSHRGPDFLSFAQTSPQFTTIFSPYTHHRLSSATQTRFPFPSSPRLPSLTDLDDVLGRCGLRLCDCETCPPAASSLAPSQTLGRQPIDNLANMRI